LFRIMTSLHWITTNIVKYDECKMVTFKVRFQYIKLVYKYVCYTTTSWNKTVSHSLKKLQNATRPKLQVLKDMFSFLKAY